MHVHGKAGLNPGSNTVRKGRRQVSREGEWFRQYLLSFKLLHMTSAGMLQAVGGHHAQPVGATEAVLLNLRQPNHKACMCSQTSVFFHSSSQQSPCCECKGELVKGWVSK